MQCLFWAPFTPTRHRRRERDAAAFCIFVTVCFILPNARLPVARRHVPWASQMTGSSYSAPERTFVPFLSAPSLFPTTHVPCRLLTATGCPGGGAAGGTPPAESEEGECNASLLSVNPTRVPPLPLTDKQETVMQCARRAERPPPSFGIKVLCAPVSLAWPRHVNSPPRPPPPCALEPGARGRPSHAPVP